MAKHILLGQKGEEVAVSFLEKRGYQILHANWRYKRAEVDIVAKYQELLIFVEVKTRTGNYMGDPEEFVTEKKRRFLAEAASVYMEIEGYDWEIRFDIIAIIVENGNYELKHFKDAFFPGLS